MTFRFKINENVIRDVHLDKNLDVIFIKFMKYIFLCIFLYQISCNLICLILHLYDILHILNLILIDKYQREKV